MVIYRWYNFRGIRNLRFDAVRRPLCHICGLTEGERAEEALQHRRQFMVFREAQKVRDFQLVLRAEVWDDVGGCSVGVLKRAVATEKAEGVLDDFSFEPAVVYSYRASGADEREDSIRP